MSWINEHMLSAKCARRKWLSFIILCLVIIVGMQSGIYVKISAHELDETEDSGSNGIGDLDGDGKITPKDVTILKRYLTNDWNTNISVTIGDVDQDGSITPRDVTYLRRYLTGGWGVTIPNSTQSKAYVSQNVNMNRYNRNWYHTITSYLTKEGEYYYRAEYVGDHDVIIEKYDKNMKFLSSKNIKFDENFFWGGLFFGENYNFVILGQPNYEEDDEKVGIRIMKFDKKWKNLEIKDINEVYATLPFFDGTLRCVEFEGLLYIVSCHQMFSFYYDGVNHQANMQMIVDEDTMDVVDIVSGYMGIHPGYVSHSFNQFIEKDSQGYVYKLDQGDGYPRAIQMTPVGKKNADAFRYMYIQEFSDAISESMSDVNRTGAEVAGFKAINNGFEIAYAYDDFGGQIDGKMKFLYLVNLIKPSYSSQGKEWELIGDKIYCSDGRFSARAPMIVSIGYNDGGYVLWDENEIIETSDGVVTEVNNGTVCFIRYYSDGSHSNVYSFQGDLSDCEPIYSDGKVIWYVTDNSTPKFFSIDIIDNSVSVCFADSTISRKINVRNRYEYVTCDMNESAVYLFWSDENQENIPIDKIYFPDENFRNYILDEIDCNKDGILSYDERSIEKIDCHKMNISDLTGIAVFKNLKSLFCSNNNLTKLDVSKNTSLKSLGCAVNQLKYLDLSKNLYLTDVNCFYNKLSELDFSKNLSITFIECSFNQLTDLDVSKNEELETLSCSNNNLTILDVSNNKALQLLWCTSNQLTYLDLSNNPEISTENVKVDDNVILTWP